MTAPVFSFGILSTCEWEILKGSPTCLSPFFISPPRNHKNKQAIKPRKVTLAFLPQRPSRDRCHYHWEQTMQREGKKNLNKQALLEILFVTIKSWHFFPITCLSATLFSVEPKGKKGEFSPDLWSSFMMTPKSLEICNKFIRLLLFCSAKQVEPVVSPQSVTKHSLNTKCLHPPS